MDHPRLILHVGGAKCGSSAFQTALSTQAQLTPPEGPGVVYAALHARRGLLHGPKLRALARKKGFGYISSAPAQKLQDLDRAERTRMMAELRALVSHHDHVVLSSESWLLHYGMMAHAGLLDALGLPFGVFAVVRPQIEFINSGWWQWGAWQGASFEKWTAHRQAQAMWYSHLCKWQAHPACTDVSVRLLSRDIVGDFLDAYGLTPAPELHQGKAANVSLPGEVLRLFQRHPDLRTGRATVDFILSKFDLGNQPTPWVIDPGTARKIVDQSRADNEGLCGMLPADQAARMRATAGWWSADAYADRPLETHLSQPVDPAAAARLHAGLTKALISESLAAETPQAGDLATPLPHTATPDQLDTRNAELVTALLKTMTAQRPKDTAPQVG